MPEDLDPNLSAAILPSRSLSSRIRNLVPRIISHNADEMRFVTTQKFWWMREKRYLVFTENGPVEFAFRPLIFFSGLGMLSMASLLTVLAFYVMPSLPGFINTIGILHQKERIEYAQPLSKEKPEPDTTYLTDLIRFSRDSLSVILPHTSQEPSSQSYSSPPKLSGAHTNIELPLPENMLSEAEETSMDFSNPEPVTSIIATERPKNSPLQETEMALMGPASPMPRPIEKMDPEYVGYNSLSKSPVLDDRLKLYRRFYSMLFEIQAIERLFYTLSIVPDQPPEKWDSTTPVVEEQIPKLLLLRESWRELMGQVPLKPPMRYYYLSSKYGPRTNKKTGVRRFHHGVDMAGTWHSPVLPSANGKVIFAGHNGSFGKVVRIEHAHGMETIYAHLSKIMVKKGEYVTTSTVLGNMGNTGNSQNMHLHYEIRTQGKSVDPEPFLKAGHEISVSGKLPSHLNF